MRSPATSACVPQPRKQQVLYQGLASAMPKARSKRSRASAPEASRLREQVKRTGQVANLASAHLRVNPPTQNPPRNSLKQLTKFLSQVCRLFPANRYPCNRKQKQEFLSESARAAEGACGDSSATAFRFLCRCTEIDAKPEKAHVSPLEGNT